VSKRYTPQYIEQILINNDFKFVSQKGSHKKYFKDNLTVIVPFSKKEVPIGTFCSILKQSKLSKDDFK